MKSREGPVQVPADSGQVSVKSLTGLGEVPSRSRQGPRHALTKYIILLKIKKWFTVLKTVNHFPKIKEEFSVKWKIFSFDYYFTSK